MEMTITGQDIGEMHTVSELDLETEVGSLESSMDALTCMSSWQSGLRATSCHSLNNAPSRLQSQNLA